MRADRRARQVAAQRFGRVGGGEQQGRVLGCVAQGILDRQASLADAAEAMDRLTRHDGRGARGFTAEPGVEVVQERLPPF